MLPHHTWFHIPVLIIASSVVSTLTDARVDLTHLETWMVTTFQNQRLLREMERFGDEMLTVQSQRCCFRGVISYRWYIASVHDQNGLHRHGPHGHHGRHSRHAHYNKFHYVRVTHHVTHYAQWTLHAHHDLNPTWLKSLGEGCFLRNMGAFKHSKVQWYTLGEDHVVSNTQYTSSGFAVLWSISKFGRPGR